MSEEFRIVPPDWNHQALISAGASVIVSRYDDDVLTGLEVRPAVSDEAYEAALIEVERLELLAYARERRKAIEIGGLVWSGVTLATDEASQIKTAGARIKAMSDPHFETTWYSADGSGVVVDATLIIAMSDAVLAHIDNSFTRYGLALAAIENGSITDRAGVDAILSSPDV